MLGYFAQRAECTLRTTGPRACRYSDPNNAWSISPLQAKGGPATEDPTSVTPGERRLCDWRPNHRHSGRSGALRL